MIGLAIIHVGGIKYDTLSTTAKWHRLPY
jgi:hypothetical protein